MDAGAKMNKSTLFILSILMFLAPDYFIDSVYPDSASENNLYVSFDRPFFPQWENGSEVSNPAMGYRLKGRPADMILYGYGLDPEEKILVENRNIFDEVVSGGTLIANDKGEFYLRVDTELPDDFTAGHFYNICYTRENGEAVRAGSFYIAAPPPDYYLYRNSGNLTFGFACDKAGKPYLLAWLSYGGGPNILDNYNNERGREFQGDLFDGYPDHGDNIRYDSVDPTQGAGDSGNILPVIERSQVEPDYIWAEFKPLDYLLNNSDSTGPYRAKVIEGRWPEVGWTMTTEYTLSENDVLMYNKFWHTDSYNHRVHQIRTAQIFLNPVFFQNPPLNKDKRIAESYLSAIIADDQVEVYSDALGLKISFQADIDNYNDYFFQRQWNYLDYYGLAEPGNVQVWESLNVAEINEFIEPGEVLSGWGKITVTETDRLGFGFDMDKFKEYLRMISKQKNYR